MKALIIMLISSVAMAQEPQVNGNNNNVNICQPKIEIKTCGSCGCNAKPKVKIVTKVVEKKVEVPVVVEKVVEVEKKVTVEKRVEVEKKVIKKHIVSLFAHRAVTGGSESSSNNAAHADVRTAIVPGLMYQYQFDRGLVPMIGVDSTGKLIGAIGIEF